MKFIIANWKSHKNVNETKEWLNTFLQYEYIQKPTNIRIIICPPFSLLSYVKEKTLEYPHLNVGAQDISQYPEGAYTGEMNGKSLQGLADYVIIGHSERRMYQKENDEICLQKYSRALEFGLIPIYCISSIQQPIPKNAQFVAYEPIESIGSGNPQNIDSVVTFYHNLAQKPKTAFIYGGSVNQSNINSYLNNSIIDGVLIGTASLSPTTFYSLIDSFLQKK